MSPRYRLRFFTSMMLLIATVGMLFCFSWSFSSPLLSRWGSVRTCACRKCLTEGDSCFDELVREAPKPFLSKTFRPNEDTFNWWKKLQGSKCNFTFYNATLDRMFQIIAPFPHVVGPSPDRCITCAVVGNSGTLNGSRSGSLIDSHDIVMRMNRGRTKGYEVDVGTKTTHHAFYPESATKLDNSTYLIFFPFKISDFAWFFKKFSPEKNSAAKSVMLANKDLVMLVNPAIMRHTHQEWLARNGHWPSTGFLTFVVSLYMCDQVDVYGFGADKDGNWNHYFEILRNKRLKTGAHPGEYEYNTIKKLHRKKKIQFFKG